MKLSVPIKKIKRRIKRIVLLLIIIYISFIIIGGIIDRVIKHNVLQDNCGFNFKTDESNKYIFNKCIDCNIIFLSLDGFRPDHLSTLGYFRDTSPNIDELSKKGIVFSNTYSQAYWTLPSHTTMFSSLYPSVHQRVSSLMYKKEPLTLIKILKDNGYLTLGFGSAGFLGKKSFGTGFDNYMDDYLVQNEEDKIVVPLSDKYKYINDTIVSNKDKKFFMFIHSNDAWTQQAYNIEKFDKDNKYSIVHNPFIWPDPEDKVAVQHYIAHYDNGIFLADKIIGNLISLLKEQDISNKTMIVITSDHGHEFYEHGSKSFGHDSQSLNEESIRVLFILYNPKSNEKGLLIDKPVGLIDVLPTVLELIDIPITEFIQGSSTVPLIKNEDSFRKYVFSEIHDVSTREVVRNTIIADRWKLVVNYDSKKDNLYNLRDDPCAYNNVIDKENRIKTLLKNKIIQIDDYNKNISKKLYSKYMLNDNDYFYYNEIIDGFEIIDVSYNPSYYEIDEVPIVEDYVTITGKYKINQEKNEKIKLRLSIIKNINYDKFSKTVAYEKTMINSVYDRTRIGYPGIISKEIICSEEFLPLFDKEETKNIISENMLYYVNQREIIGGCSWDTISSRTIKSYVYSKNKDIMFIIELFQHYDQTEQQLDDIDKNLKEISLSVLSNMLESV